MTDWANASTETAATWRLDVALAETRATGGNPDTLIIHPDAVREVGGSDEVQRWCERNGLEFRPHPWMAPGTCCLGRFDELFPK